MSLYSPVDDESATAKHLHGPGWITDQVSFRYPGNRELAVTGISAVVSAGRCTTLLGPNGSGKSTLLRLLLGVLRPTGGHITFDGKPIGDWSRRELARVVGVVPQVEEISFPLTVREMVSMGRYPHLGAFRAPTERDHVAIEQAMKRSDVFRMADRQFQSLSGGERQRARIARALAQEPAVLALDEPTLALDVRHEMEIFELTRDLVAEGVTVVLVTHNLNLAARYADALLLLDKGSIATAGSPTEVLSRDRFQQLYDWQLLGTVHPGPGRDTGAPQLTPLARPDRD